MKKIPTLFERDWEGDRSLVVSVVTNGCEWVIAGEGQPYAKLDGTCCMTRNGALYKRREIKAGKDAPVDFEWLETDDVTGKSVGWVPVGDGPEDKWHREAFERQTWPDGTYELIGPKIQGNTEQVSNHILVSHADEHLRGSATHTPRTFEGLRVFFKTANMEGIVWHHPDGRMAKIKGRDFGIKRKLVAEAAE